MITVVPDFNLNFTRPYLYPKQRQAIFDPHRYSVIEASSKAGKTSGCIVWLFERAFAGKEGQNFWWVAPVSDQARIAFRRALRAIPRDMYRANISDKAMTLINGAIVMFKSGDKADSLYGEDVYAAVVDEASRLKEDAWHAVRSTLAATRGPVRIIGNVKGRKNWFFQMARRAEAGDPAMGYHKMTAMDAIDAGVLAQDEVEDARRTLPDHVFQELFMASAYDDHGNPFGIASIRRCIEPMPNTMPVVWGWDLAKHIDWTVGIALDHDGKVCRFDRFQLPWEETKDRILKATRGVPALVDSTGVGDPILEWLQKYGGGNFEGYPFSSPSKQKLMEGLAMAIQSHEVTFPDGPIVVELENFEYEYTRTGVRYSAPEGSHDDCVCALALAKMHQARGHTLLRIPPEVLAWSAMRGLPR